MRSRCCLCVCVCLCVSPPINFWTSEPIFVKLGMYITAHEPLNGLIKKSLSSIFVSVCVSPYRC
jgi:hypothetical protein